MPELPDVNVYVEALDRRVTGRTLQRVRVKSPFLVRTVDPPIEATEGRTVRSVSRLGKRLVFELEQDLWLVLHLMIAGRVLWKRPDARPTGKIDLAALNFESGTVLITEAGTKKRAGLWVASGRAALTEHTRGGLEVQGSTLAAFTEAIVRENRTLKRALTDPRLFSGIGNAYSDEILHAARLSPMLRTQALNPEQTARLHAAARRVLDTWTQRLRAQFGLADGSPGRFPGVGQITAFRPDFAVHGRFGQPCPVCGVKVQRVAFAENELNYCPRCQTDDKILADRSLSRLLKDDWPGTVDELE